MNTVIQTRIDSETRQNAEKVLNAMGFTLNDGIRIFLRQVINEQALPFRPAIRKEPTEEIKRRMDKAELEDDLIRFKSVKDFSKWLDSAE